MGKEEVGMRREESMHWGTGGMGDEGEQCHLQA